MPLVSLIVCTNCDWKNVIVWPGNIINQTKEYNRQASRKCKHKREMVTRFDDKSSAVKNIIFYDKRLHSIYHYLNMIQISKHILVKSNKKEKKKPYRLFKTEKKHTKHLRLRVKVLSNLSMENLCTLHMPREIIFAFGKCVCNSSHKCRSQHCYKQLFGNVKENTFDYILGDLREKNFQERAAAEVFLC